MAGVFSVEKYATQTSKELCPSLIPFFLPEMPVFISCPRICNEQILVFFVNEKLRPTSLRIFCSHCLNSECLDPSEK